MVTRTVAGSLAGATVGADVVLYAAAEGGWDIWRLAGFAVLAIAAVVVIDRWPGGAFVGAGLLACTTGAAFCLLLLTSYRAGSARLATWRIITATGVVATLVFLRAALSAERPVPVAPVVAQAAVFVLVPVLAGRLHARHRDLVSALASRNCHLEAERVIAAQQERLRQRLRLARDIHDVLGRHLCMATLAAAGLRDTATTDRQRELSEQVLDHTRTALAQTHVLVGGLRNLHDRDAAAAQGMNHLDEICAQFRRAGMTVNLLVQGEPAARLSPVVSHAAARVLQEGLTNAATHAAGRPVTVAVTWESDALLLRVVNGCAGRAVTAQRRPARGGHGLAGLAEQVDLVGGLIEHTDRSVTAGTFVLSAMLPLDQRDAEPAGTLVAAGGLGPVKAVAMALLFLVVPASMLLGVG